MAAPSLAHTVPRRWSWDRSLRGAVPYAFLAPLVLFLFVATLYPTYVLLRLSLSSYVMGLPFTALPFVGPRNFGDVLTNPLFWNAVRVTLVYMAGVVGLELLLGVAIALVLAPSFPGRGLVRTLILLPMMATPIVVGTMWKALYNVEYGAVSYYVGQLLGFRPNWLGSPNLALFSVVLVDVWQWTPFIALIAVAALEGIPGDVVDAARVDGADRWQLFRHIELPLISSALLIGVFLRALDAFKIFDNIFALTSGGPGNNTQTLSVLVYQTMYLFQDGGSAGAQAVLMLVLANVIGGQIFMRRFGHRLLGLRREGQP